MEVLLSILLERAFQTRALILLNVLVPENLTPYFLKNFIIMSPFVQTCMLCKTC